MTGTRRTGDDRDGSTGSRRAPRIAGRRHRVRALLSGPDRRRSARPPPRSLPDQESKRSVAARVAGRADGEVTGLPSKPLGATPATSDPARCVHLGSDRRSPRTRPLAERGKRRLSTGARARSSYGSRRPTSRHSTGAEIETGQRVNRPRMRRSVGSRSCGLTPAGTSGAVSERSRGRKTA